MASNTTEGVSLTPASVGVSVTAGVPAASEDRFDPFLPAFEPAVEECSLQQSMGVNKESLKRRLMLRRSVAELADQGIYPPLKTPPAFAEQRKQLEMAKTSDMLRKKLTARPDRQCLVQHHILEDTNPLVDSCVQERQRQLKRSRLQENLSDHLVHRPGPLDLVNANILKLEPVLSASAGEACGGLDEADLFASLDEFSLNLLDNESYEGSQSSPTLLVTGSGDYPTPDLSSYDHDDVFSPPLLGTADAVAPCLPRIPVAPDILPLLRSSRTSANEQTVSRVPTPPDITPLLQGALSSANIQLPSSSAQPTSMTSAVSKSTASGRGNVTKKSRPKIGTKSKVIKFHQYLGPKNLQHESCATTPSTANTPLNILLQQQQMLLQWQLDFQQKNMQFLLSMPSNEPPKPSPSVLATSTLAPQPTAVNAAANPSTNIAASNPILAGKRGRLEEMKVPELREECRRLSLARSGPKPVLIERLLPYAEDVLNSSNASPATESKPPEQVLVSSAATDSIAPALSSIAPALSIASNADTAPNVMFNIQQPMKMIPDESAVSNAVSCNMSAVPMDIDTASCKQEPTTPDIARPNVYPFMLIPANNNGSVVQASVSSTVPPLIVLRPAAQPLIRPSAATTELKSMSSMPPSMQQQILLEQQRHINELEYHLQLSQQELVRAQQQAQLQRMPQSDPSLWMNNAALSGSSLSSTMAADLRAQAPQLQRTNSVLAMSPPSAFDNKLRRSMTSPYISTMASVVHDGSQKNLLSSFAASQPVQEPMPSVRTRTIDDVLISNGDIPPSAVPYGSQLTTAVASCCSLFFVPNAPGMSTARAAVPCQSTASVPAAPRPSSNMADSMDWYSADTSQPPCSVSDGPARIDTLHPTEQVDFSGLLSKSTAAGDLGNIDIDWLDDLLQPGCGVTSDFMNLDDCDFCSPADGVRASFEKLMEVTTSKS